MRITPRRLAPRRSDQPPSTHSGLLRRSTSVLAAGALLLGGLGSMAGASIDGSPLPAERAGTVLTWGGSATAKGHEDPVGEPQPTEGKEVVGIWGTNSYALALATDGSLTGWGGSAQANVWDQIPDDLGQVTSVATGSTTAFAVRDDGTLRAWGGSTAGGLQVPEDAQSGVVKAVAGQRINAALLQDGTVRAWGQSLSGADQVPPGLSDVVDVAAVTDGLYALKSDGTIVAWGNVQSDLPAAPLPDAERLAASGVQVFALDSAGTAVFVGGAYDGRVLDVGEPIVSVSGGLPTVLKALGSSGRLYNVAVQVGQNTVTETPEVQDRRVEAVIGATSRQIAIVSDAPIDDGASVVTDPVLSGDPVVNRTLTLSPAEFSAEPDGAVVTRFFRQPAEGDAVEITGSFVNGLTVRVPSQAVGQDVFATQTVTIDGEELVATSEPVGPVEQLVQSPDVESFRPAIAGDAEVGAELSIERAGQFLPAGSEVTVTNQWFADGEPIEGATGETFTVTADQVGQSITLRQTGTTPSGLQEVQTGASNAIGPIPAPPASVVTDPVLSGDPVVNRTLTLSPAEFSAEPDGPVVTRFFRQPAEGDAVEITGSFVNGLTVRVPSQAVGQDIFATQTVTIDGEELVATAAPVGPVEQLVQSPDIESFRPAIAGDAEVGAELSIERAGQFLPAGSEVTITNQWFADGEPIEGATGETFTVTADQVGQSITLRQTGTTPSGLQEVQTGASNAIGPIPAPPLAEVTAPVISGTAKVGETLTGTPATFNATDGVTVTNQWLADGEPIEGATGTELELTEAQLDADITFRSTAVRGEEEPAVSTSEAVGPVLRADIAIDVDSPPSIEGTAKVGQTLTGTSATFTGDTEGEPTQQWLADGEPIDGATSLTLELTDAQAGKVITLRSTQAGIGGPLSSTSEPTAAVQARLAATADPSISGTARVGQTLTGTPATFAGNPAAVTNQWLADGEPIDGATGTGLALTEELEGAVITFASTATRDGDDPVTATSAATAPVAPAQNGGDNGDGDGDGDGDGQTPNPPAEDLRGAIEIIGDGPFQPGDTITVRVGDDYIGQEVSVWMFSEPRNLGTFTVASNGTIRVAIPRDAELGEHTLAVYDADGNLIGFDTLVLGSADGTGGGLGGALERGLLPNGGSPLSVAVWSLGLAMMLAGLAVLVIPAAMRRRARPA